MQDVAGFYGRSAILLSETYTIAKAKFDNMHIVEVADAEVKMRPTPYIIRYYGTTALTLSDYNNLPNFTEIVDFQAGKHHMKTGDTTWLSSAAYT
jgi:hypothetical protein